MARRLSILARGPLLLLVLLAAIAAGVLLSGGRVHSSSLSPTPTAKPRPTATPGPLYAVSFSGPAHARDPGNGASAALQDARIQVADRRHVRLLLQLAVQSGASNDPYGPKSFFLVTHRGITYPATATTGGLPALGAGLLATHHERTGWIAFTLPARTATLDLIWTDNTRLFPPSVIATMHVMSLSSATT